jgi:c(7)-type cytochrome triheme protein
MSLLGTLSPRALFAAGVGVVLVVGPALAAGPPRVELPPDSVYQASPDSPAPVVFRHWTHVALQGNLCDGCHIGLFRILAPARSARHEEMDAGQGCGSCHDGERAFATRDDDACLYCHGGESPLAPLPPAPEGRLLGASTLATSADSLGPVRFDHRVHLGSGALCTSCHPALAPMQAGSAPASKEQMLEGASCGTCHDGERAFGVDDERCERCHDTGEDQP